MEVVEITPSQVRVRNPYLLSVTCYDTSGGKRESSKYGHTWTGISLRRTQYTFSDDNWLTAIGCDDLVLGIGEGNRRFGGGCVSYCNDSTDSHGFGFCPENNVEFQHVSTGCCRNTVPRGITMLGVQFIDLSNKWRNGKLFPCSYAFITEKAISSKSEGFSFPLSYLNNSTAFVADDWRNTKGALPVVRLDWRIGAENCSQASRNSTTYACQNNTECIDYEAEIKGYLCRCKDGYRGNPYIRCDDVDECADNKPCDSNAVCINTPGSFVCSCPKWYYGDGKKEGKGCIPSRVIYVFIGVASGLGFLLLLSMCLCWHKILLSRKDKRCKQKFFKKNGGLLLQKNTSEGTVRKARLFSMEELEKATDNFNKSRLLGQGGQGRVYKGMLYDGNIVAIKKSKLVNKDLLEQFINEVVILSQINHKNVVKLLGCCLETEVPMLVYEFLPNGTLSNLIHDPNIEFRVSWNMRLKMAADIAGALMYLHSASDRPIYHRDIKSSNILLDEKYAVKISDFGISRFVEEDQTHLTTKVKGTFGYFDPEYFQSHQFTEKSDVYSFGVVLLELLSGQRPVCSERLDEDRSLVTRFLVSVEENNLDSILDSRVLEEGVKKEMITVALLAHRCLNLNGKMRPTMREVATNLESLRMSQMPITIDHKSKENGMDRAKSVKISDSEYTWGCSGISETSSSSDTLFIHSNKKMHQRTMSIDESC
ncbi:hypothetical protein C2S53_000643 [Perilla frutescens var. hirtella]|uniref:Uncharacterized protein n=1 Tax=Perilla frutescens var. hirtella TaxID=608512 RepID=A0AAD4IVV5_PERFH|nr:hypothetical protein C2S53_000643 [Perilla frutescens var. hirtella]